MPRKKAVRRKRVAAVARKKPGPKPGMRRGRRGRIPSGRVKKPFSIVLDEHELNALKDIAAKKRTSVASLIRGAMNAVVFQTNPKLARAALEKDVEAFLDGIKGRLPMKDRFDTRKKSLKKNLVSGIISNMEKL